jgi:hypothetical protein
LIAPTLITITTCPRAGVNYLPGTAAALLRAGADACTARLVLADGEPPAETPPGWDLDFRFPRSGDRLMMWWAFERALATGVERLIYCEDDITPCRNAVRRMLRLPIPESVAFVDFHDNRELPDGTAAGLHEVPAQGRAGRGYLGNLCMMFPRRTLAWLAQQDPLSILPQQRRGMLYHASDLVLGAFLAASPWPRYLAHLPRLVRHDGLVSAAHPEKGLRATREFPGADFDALTLAAEGVALTP